MNKVNSMQKLKQVAIDSKRAVKARQKHSWLHRLLFGSHPLLNVAYCIPVVLLGYVIASNFSKEIDYRLNNKELLVAQRAATNDTEAFFISYVRDCYSSPAVLLDDCIANYVTENPQGVGFQTMDQLTRSFFFDLLSFQYNRVKLIKQK